jgi:RES domain
VTALYRVFPLLADAAPDEPGGALYVPPQGGGRLDNPDLFSVLYLSNAPAGAIAETFGRFPEWTPAILEGSPSLPESAPAIGRYRLPGEVRVCDLDDPDQLRALALRPSDVVSRDYARTRAWARRIYEQRGWAGVRWWSYYDPRWASIGLWDTARLTIEEVRPLRLTDPEMVAASRVILRRIVRSRGVPTEV